MNRSAERHLAKAEGYLEKGEGFYHKAAAEIVAAKEADPAVSNREIGERFGRDASWVSRLVTWHTSDSPGNAPFAGATPEAKGRGTVEAKRVLRDAPLERVEQMISELPPERAQDIAAAAGHAYHKARQELRQTEARLTPGDRREREQAAERLTRPAKQAAAGFTALGIVDHLDQAAEQLRELAADSSLTPSVMRQVERAFENFKTMLNFALQLLGMDEVE